MGESHSVHYLANLVYDGLPRRADAFNTLFFFAHVKDMWSEILNSWFDTAEILRNAAYTLWSDILQPPIGVENRFLPLTQSIEGFSRAIGDDDRYLSAYDYESIKIR